MYAWRRKLPRTPLMTTLQGYRGILLDYVGDPTSNPGALRLEEDGLLIVSDGTIHARGSYAALRATHPNIDLVDHRGKLLLPGFIDGHVHYPQTGMIAAYGEQLLEWLERYTFPTERRFGDPVYAAQVAETFATELVRHGTTTAVVLCTVHPESVDALANVALRRNLRLVLGKVLMDRNAPPDLCDTAERAYTESKTLIERWHGRGRLLYAITPRFAPTSTPEQLTIAAELWREHPSTYIHTHLSENQAEIAWARSLFPRCASYTDIYDHYGLVTAKSLFAHGVHLVGTELATLAREGSTLAFCPTANLFLGSGLFPYRHVCDAGVAIVLGTDVGAGTSFSLLRTLSEAYKVLQLQGQRLSVHHGLFWATLGGATALGLDHVVGNFEPGKDADFVVLDFESTPLLRVRAAEATDLDERLFALMMLGDDRSVHATYLAGVLAHSVSGAEADAPPKPGGYSA